MATDKRKTQISLPLEFEDKKYQGLVKQNWQITFARQSNFGVAGKRIMGMVLSQIRENNYEEKPYYQFSVSDIVKILDIDRSSARKQIKEALFAFTRTVWEFEDEELEIYEPRQLVTTEATYEEDGYAYGIRNGLVTMVFSKVVHRMLVNIAHYSSMELDPYIRFKSWYSTRLWEIFSAYRDTGQWNVSISEYRKLMDCEKKYNDNNLLIRKTTEEPLAEFTGTPFEGFDVKKIYDSFSRRGRRPLVGLEFHFKKEVPPEDKVAKWLEKSKYKHLYKGLLDYRVTPKNILQYAGWLGVEGVSRLLTEWQQKDISGDPIKDRLKYCNKTFVAEGKKAMKKKKT